MSQYDIRKELEDVYQYIEVPEKFAESEIKKYTDWVYGNVHRIFNKEYSTEKNTEWVVRHYLAAKMIYAASVMVSSLQYCEDKNVNIVKPYLSYYAVLTCCRALIFVLPNQQWREAGLIEATHSKIANAVKDACSQFDMDFGKDIFRNISRYRENRELFSYRFPASGLTKEYCDIGFESTVSLCKLLCEIAQLTSTQIEKYYLKNFQDCSFDITIESDNVRRAFVYEMKDNESVSIIDSEDWYRIDYICRKQPMPASIYMTMSEGMTEDFFGAWCPEEEDEEVYNPDVDWNIIFNVP